jgi:hypothetical protein
MSDLIQFEGGAVLADLQERTITGLLIPYGEEGRTNVGRFQVEAGAISLPADAEVVGLNLDHERPAVVGRAVRVWEEPAGVMATFRIARTPEGDAALEDARAADGRRRKLSGEFGPAIIKAGRLVAGHAKLWGAALVEAGAFPSAQVLAADTPDADETRPGPLEGDDPERLGVRVNELPAEIIATTPEGESATYTPDAAPAEGNPTTEEEGSTVTATTTAAGAPAPATEQHVTAGAVPATMLPGAPAAPARTEDRGPDTRHVLAAIAAFKADPGDRAAEQVLAALTDITLTGTNSLPGNGSNSLLQPAWLGALYQGVPYEREYIQLGNLGTDITAGGKKGFQVKRGTSGTPIAGPDGIPNGGDWAGNKAEINSYNGHTSPITSTLDRFAVGNDIAREFYDLPGGAEFVEAFLSLILEDHLFWSDTKALEKIVAAAGAPIAPTTAAYSTAYPEAVGMLIQGILAVKARKADGRRDVPTFAIVNELAYEEMAYAAGGEEALPAFVSLVVTTASRGTVDGNVQVVQGDIGIADTAAVIVGAQRAIEFDELPGGPLRVDALEVAKGGIDRAVHGYLQTFIPRPSAIVAVGTADV